MVDVVMIDWLARIEHACPVSSYDGFYPPQSTSVCYCLSDTHTETLSVNVSLEDGSIRLHVGWVPVPVYVWEYTVPAHALTNIVRTENTRRHTLNRTNIVGMTVWNVAHRPFDCWTNIQYACESIKTATAASAVTTHTRTHHEHTHKHTNTH